VGKQTSGGLLDTSSSGGTLSRCAPSHGSMSREGPRRRWKMVMADAHYEAFMSIHDVLGLWHTFILREKGGP
jgi:hypothetical protein